MRRGPPWHAKIDLFLLARTFHENILDAKTSRKPCENLAKTWRKPHESLAKTSRKPCDQSRQSRYIKLITLTNRQSDEHRSLNTIVRSARTAMLNKTSVQQTKQVPKHLFSQSKRLLRSKIKAGQIMLNISGPEQNNQNFETKSKTPNSVH